MTWIILAHMLILVFWVGGDLGAFLASFAVADATQPAPARLAAARLIEAVDMAPRTSLVLALPTGLTLANALGLVGATAAWVAWTLALPWLALVWALHRRGAGEASGLARLDETIRLAVIAGCVAAAAAIYAGGLDLPWFIAAKLLLLAAAIGCGVAIRALLLPFAPAFARALADAGDQPAQAEVRRLLMIVRVAVVGIWLFVTAAAAIGIRALAG